MFKVLFIEGKASPNIWGRFAAAVGRVVSSVFTDGALKLEVYVADPLFAIAGPRGVRSRNFTIAMLVPLIMVKSVCGRVSGLDRSIIVAILADDHCFYPVGQDARIGQESWGAPGIKSGLQASPPVILWQSVICRWHGSTVTPLSYHVMGSACLSF